MAQPRNCAGDRTARRGTPQSGGQIKILNGWGRKRVLPQQLRHSARNATRHSNQTRRRNAWTVLALRCAKAEAEAPGLGTEPKLVPPRVQQPRFGSAAPR